MITGIKWICPTAPTCPVAILGGFPRTAWFDVRELSEDSPDDFEGLDASVAHIANLLSTEPADILNLGKYGNGIDYPVNLRAIVGLSGWLPSSSFMHHVEEQDRRITGGCKACCIFAHFALSRNLGMKSQYDEKMFDFVFCKARTISTKI
ncbi:unnamed protein product [Camellia sinensis]